MNVKMTYIHETPGMLLVRMLSVCLLFSFAIDAFAQETNDTVAKDLQEVTVEADMQSVNATSATFYPTKYVKQAAQNGYDLLSRMNIPNLSVGFNSSTISTIAGQSVTVFINYVKSSPEEMSGLRGQDVVRVEYLDYPSDSRFQGAPHVINIIMRNYEYGGYTKLSDTYVVLDGVSNGFRGFSKFSYKSMTYDLYAGFNNNVLNHEGSSEKSLFSLASGDVERIQDYKDSRQTDFSVPVTFRALWKSEKVTISNTVGFNFSEALKRYESGGIRFNPEGIYDGNDYEYNIPMISRSVTWNGNYYFSFPKNWSLSFDPGAVYSHYNATNEYTLSLDGVPKEKIVNNSREDAWNLNIFATLRKIIGNHNLSLTLSERIRGNDISYYGTSPSTADFRENLLGARFFYTFNYGNTFSVNASVGVSKEWKKTNGERYNDLYPVAHAYVAYSPHSKSRFTAWFQYASNNPNAFMRSPNVVKKEEMLYQTGNPLISNARHYTVEVQYQYYPSNIFYIMLGSQYYWSNNTPVRCFSEYDDGNALLLSYRNMGAYHKFGIFGDFTLRLLGGRLNFTASPQYGYFETSGYSHDKVNMFMCRLSAQYYFGNFYLTAFYNTPIRRLEELSEIKNHIPAMYWAQFGWSKGSWNLTLSMVNFLKYNYKGIRSEYVSPLYSSNSVAFTYTNHAYGMLTATYTFGYGKKATDRSEIGAQEGASSSRM